MVVCAFTSLCAADSGLYLLNKNLIGISKMNIAGIQSTRSRLFNAYDSLEKLCCKDDQSIKNLPNQCKYIVPYCGTAYHDEFSVIGLRVYEPFLMEVLYISGMQLIQFILLIILLLIKDEQNNKYSTDSEISEV